MTEFFLKNTDRVKDMNYFRKKNSIMCVWQGPKYALKISFSKKNP